MDTMRGLSSIISLFRNEFNKFIKTGTRMIDFIYHSTLGILENAFWRENVFNMPDVVTMYGRLYITLLKSKNHL